MILPSSYQSPRELDLSIERIEKVGLFKALNKSVAYFLNFLKAALDDSEYREKCGSLLEKTILKINKLFIKKKIGSEFDRLREIIKTTDSLPIEKTKFFNKMVIQRPETSPHEE